MQNAEIVGYSFGENITLYGGMNVKI